MMDHHHHYHDHQDHHRPFGYGGPTSNSGANEVASVMYHKEEEEEDDVAASSVAAAAAAGSGGAVVRTLQSFDVSSITTTAFKSPGGAGMAAALGFPFTSAQLKELERQATIYKYMQASVPVPSHLLLPITPNSLDVRFCNNNKDAEPGRCKRTDGKKWRCSRDVVSPQQKYCERHMHKSRTSRSRKPVELHQKRHPTATATANKTTRLLHHHTIPPNPISTSISSPHELLRSTIQQPKFDASSYKESNRGLDWTMEGEMLAMDGSKQQQWQQQLLQTNIASVFQQDCIEESLNLIPYPNFGAHQNDECNLFLNPDLETPRGFIDAWSNEDPNTTNESSVSSHGNLSPSSLTLSMATAAAGGDALNDEMGGQIQMGLGVRDSDHYEPQLSSWLSSVSWVGSTAPGGPLAEVLRPSSAAAVVSSNPTSPHACNGDSISTPGTKVSSPSAATPEIMPFQWLS